MEWRGRRGGGPAWCSVSPCLDAPCPPPPARCLTATPPLTNWLLKTILRLLGLVGVTGSHGSRLEPASFSLSRVPCFDCTPLGDTGRMACHLLGSSGKRILSIMRHAEREDTRISGRTGGQMVRPRLLCCSQARLNFSGWTPLTAGRGCPGLCPPEARDDPKSVSSTDLQVWPEEPPPPRGTLPAESSWLGRSSQN